MRRAKRKRVALAIAAGIGLWAGATPVARGVETVRIYSVEKKAFVEVERVDLADSQWRERLTPGQYRVLRQAGTERAFTGAYWNHHERGVYRCAGCGTDLFFSDHKFDSGTGWPSFWRPVAKENVGTREDRKFFMVRTEVHCARCGGHLGHVFPDGPPPTGLRYCINSVALGFVPLPKGE